jgi:hypothetical protein
MHDQLSRRPSLTRQTSKRETQSVGGTRLYLPIRRRLAVVSRHWVDEIVADFTCSQIVGGRGTFPGRCDESTLMPRVGRADWLVDRRANRKMAALVGH